MGLVAKPLPSMNVSLDVYQIEIKDRLMQSATLGLSTVVSDALAAAGPVIIDRIKIDVYPDSPRPANRGAPAFSYYNQYSPDGITGRFYCARLAWKF